MVVVVVVVWPGLFLDCMGALLPGWFLDLLLMAYLFYIDFLFLALLLVLPLDLTLFLDEDLLIPPPLLPLVCMIWKRQSPSIWSSPKSKFSGSMSSRPVYEKSYSKSKSTSLFN